MDNRFKLHSFTRQRDENAVAQSTFPAKTLHQRNKSTPALNSFASAKSISLNPLRRAAFADVSNTRVVAVKDEGVNKAKNIALELKHFGPTQKDNAAVKPLQTVDVNAFKPQNLMRPLQRPINKALPAAPINSDIVANSQSIKPQLNGASVKSLTDNTSLVDYAPVRKTIIKRHTTIFRETSIGSTAPPPTEVSVPESAPSETSTQISPVIQDSLTSSVKQEESVPVIEDVKEPVSSIVEPTISTIVPETLAIPSTDFIDPPVKLESDSCSVANLISVTEISAPHQYLTHVKEEPQALEPELYLPALETQLPLFENTLLDEKVIQPQVITDLEEYWEEEIAEEEFFDAEGCVTARSLRSMGGENTTSGMSTVMMPRVTSRVERELLAAKAWVEETGFAEITDDEAWDTTMVTEYGDEIFLYMRELENRMMPNPYYMENQAEIQWSMRSVLVDWVTQVHTRFGLLPETLFLAVNCIDRFLSVKVVSLAKLQLVGATAIYVAAKYEEINCPSVQEIAYMVDGSYTIEEILKAERFMLTMLKFEMGWPGPMSFLRRISKADDYDVETRTLAKYFLEVTLMDERFVGCVPSFLAAGSHCLARLMLGKGDWGAAHVFFSQYTYSQLFTLMNTILNCCEAPRTHHIAVYEKYSDKRYKRASTFVEGEMSKGFDLPQVARESVGNQSQSWRRK